MRRTSWLGEVAHPGWATDGGDALGDGEDGCLDPVVMTLGDQLQRLRQSSSAFGLRNHRRRRLLTENCAQPIATTLSSSGRACACPSGVGARGQPPAGTVFPPKQVFGTVTGRVRTSFTTMEPQRALRRLGLVCREAGRREDGAAAWVPARTHNYQPDADADARLASVEARATLEAAVAGLHARVKELEAAR